MQEAVGADSPEWRALELLAKYSGDADPVARMKRELAKRKGEHVPPDAFLDDARAAGFLGEKPRLPTSSRLARRLVDATVDHEAATATELHGWFAAALRKRVDTGDEQALELACALAESGVLEAGTRLALAQMKRLESVHATMPVIRLIRKELPPPPAPK